jgi:hypothetical protein
MVEAMVMFTIGCCSTGSIAQAVFMQSCIRRATQAPRRDGALVKWSANRSATIGTLFSRVKKRSIIFPRAADCGAYLDEFACEVAEYDDLNRTVRYSYPQGQLDDALHATNYALVLSVGMQAAGRPGMRLCR